MKNDKERLLLELMHFLAEKFKGRMAVGGGMLLRLLNSPRSTQDIDYFLISDRSKKELAKELDEALARFGDAKVTKIDLNLRGIFIELKASGEGAGKVMIEIGVVRSLNLPPEQLSTVSLSNQYSMSGRVVSTVAVSEAFANKIAAAFERQNVRDLYDISVFEPLCSFDAGTFKKRLAESSINRQKAKSITPKEAASMLTERVNSLTEKRLEEELYPLIPPEQRPGLLLVIKAAVMRVVQKITGNDDDFDQDLNW